MVYQSLNGLMSNVQNQASLDIRDAASRFLLSDGFRKSRLNSDSVTIVPFPDKTFRLVNLCIMEI
jgi:hypothetical protein